MKPISTSSSRALVFCTALFCALLLQACAQTPPPVKRAVPPPPPPLQFLVYAQPGSAAKNLSPDALTQQASRIAEVPVRHEGVGSDGRHNLVLVCANVPACQAATQRLRAQADQFAAVEEAPRPAFGPIYGPSGPKP
jgi:hypothetical protein